VKQSSERLPVRRPGDACRVAVLVPRAVSCQAGRLTLTFPDAFFPLLHDRQPRISATAVTDSLRFLLSIRFIDNNASSALTDCSRDFALRCEDMMSLLRHFDRLQNMRDQLEAKLDLNDAGLCGMGYRERRDLRERISEISDEISALERSRSFQS
jgi:hypothetical protein